MLPNVALGRPRANDDAFPDAAGLTSRKRMLRFVAQALLVAVLLHALAALMFGDLRFAAFLQ